MTLLICPHMNALPADGTFYRQALLAVYLTANLPLTYSQTDCDQKTGVVAHLNGSWPGLSIVATCQVWP